MPVIPVESLTCDLKRDHRNAVFTVVLLAATVALVALSACGGVQLGVVGFDRRANGNELEIVGPTSMHDRDTYVGAPLVEEPSSLATVDDRCSTYGGQR